MGLLDLPRKVSRGVSVYADLYVRQRLPTIIFSTGRVGSMALFQSLYRRGVFVVAVETLDPERLAEGNKPGTWNWTYKHIIKPRRPAKILTIVRDPLALMVSDYFPKLKWITGQPEAYNTLSVGELCEIFNTTYFEQERHTFKLTWFEREFEPALGINIFDHPFDTEEGWTRLQQDPYEVLVIRTGMDAGLKNQLVGEFVGLSDFEIIQFNTGEKKPYGAVYSAFKKQLTISPDLVDMVYASAYARHFFSTAQLDEMRSRWTGG